MEYRHLGTSGLKVPVLSFGAGTFGGSGPLFGAWGTTLADEARRLVDICLEAGVNMFDTADVYSNGASETVLGQAIKGRRSKVLLSTKMGLPMGDGPNDAGTPIEEVVSTLDQLVRQGKLRYTGVSNFFGWHVMKSLSVADHEGWTRYVAHQIYGATMESARLGSGMSTGGGLCTS
jgi:aryl-alcohol dehydrogenase-like predicted oxidoreductase